MDIRDRIKKYGPELQRLKETLDIAFARGATASAAREDRIMVFPFGVACRDILEEVLFAIDSGHGRSALRSVRTMYECVVFSRYVHRHPEKAEDFLDTFHVQWAKVVQGYAGSLRESSMPEIHQLLAQKVPKYASGQRITSADLDWSGVNTFKMAKESGTLSELHPIAFDYTSAFIHPSAVFLLNQVSETEPGNHFLRLSEKPQDAEAEHALSVGHDLILNAVDLRLAYSPSADLRERLNHCIDDFLGIWGYLPHL